jgi:hypothetical protein
MSWPQLKPLSLPRTESRRLSSLPWLSHVRPWTRHERASALAWEKEKTIARHLEQQFAAAQGITHPQDDDDDRSIDASSNPDAALSCICMRRLLASRTYDQWSRSF